jgi:plasmid stabilization system protein ParE
MFTMQKSALFMEQWRSYARGYRDRAGVNIAERFIVAVEEALNFIRQNPYACPPYDTGEEFEDLRTYQFRKWNLNIFPHVVLFRLGDNATIFIEVLYAHKMDIPSHLTKDMDNS